MKIRHVRSSSILPIVVLSFVLISVQLYTTVHATNGCGPGDWRGDLVPDYIFGEACDNHDDCYEYPAMDTKKNCDDTFYNEMKAICDTYDFTSYWWATVEAHRKECYSYAGDYHYAVKHFGDSRYNAVNEPDGGVDGGSGGASFGPDTPPPDEQFCRNALYEAKLDCEWSDGIVRDFDCFEDSGQAFWECEYNGP